MLDILITIIGLTIGVFLGWCTTTIIENINKRR